MPGAHPTTTTRSSAALTAAASETPSATSTRTNLIDALDAGLCWLYSTVQPNNALVERGGVRMTTGERILRFLPVGVDGDPLIIVDAQIPRWSRATTGPTPGSLPEAELRSLAEQLAELGVPAHSWQYHSTTGTVALAAPAHPSLRAAVDRFSQGCPWHHSHVCDAPISAGGHGCTWHAQGHDAAIWPQVAGCSCRPAVKVCTAQAD